MDVLHSLKQKQAEISFTRSLNKTLDKILDKIELAKGNFNIADIYKNICQGLTAINIPSLIAIYDQRKKSIFIKNYCPSAEDDGLMANIIENELIDREMPLSPLRFYQMAFNNSYPFFYKNRSKDLLHRYPQYKSNLGKKDFNSIVAPLVLRGEAIGAIELFSPALNEAHLTIINNFTKSLAKSIANIILYQEIKKSEERYWDLFDNSYNGLIIFNKKRKFFVETNNKISQLAGYTRDEFQQINYLNLFTHEEKKKIEQLIENGNRDLIETKIVSKNGGNKFVELAITPTNTNYELLLNFNDITAEKIAEEKCKELDELNRRILDTSPISIVVLNRDGQIITANSYAKKILNLSKENLFTDNLLATEEISKNEILKNLYKKLLAKGSPFHYDDLAYWSNTEKKEKHFDIVAVPLLNKDQEVEGAISMAIDNTDAVVAKEKLKELNRHLEEKVKKRTEQLAMINEELGKILELKQKFISDASHELRTPLTVIQGNLDLAMQELQKMGRRIPEIYKLIRKEVEQMTSILTDLTMLTNADTNTEKLKYEKIELGVLTSSVEQSLRVLAKKKNITIEVRELEKPIVIYGDESKLEKVLLNLVRNAIKYTNRNGLIEIWTDKDNEGARINVKDNGIGIPEKDLPYIFERFYRVDKARSRNEGGTGLGLSIVKWAVEAHGGKVTVESELNRGSLFTVHLPTKR